MQPSENSQSSNLQMENKSKSSLFDTPTSLFKRLGLFISMIRYGNAHNVDFAIEHYDFFENLIKNVNRLGVNTNNIRISQITVKLLLSEKLSKSSGGMNDCLKLTIYLPAITSSIPTFSP